MAQYLLAELSLTPLRLKVSSSLDWIPRVPSAKFQDSRQQYFQDHDLGDNLLGCGIFTSYIFAALASTLAILYNLSKSYRNLPEQSQKALLRGRHARSFLLWSVFALISFSTISWDMIMVLVTSYWNWAARHSNHVSSQGLLSNLYQWVTTSSLFTEFALGLFDDDIGFDSVFCYLVGTSLACIVTGVLGQRYKISQLWLYCVLAEILPTSFVVALFQIALLLQKSAPQQARATAKSDSPGTATNLVFQTLLVSIPWIVTEVGLRYLPQYVAIDVSQLMRLVVLIRVSLTVPFVVSCQSERVAKIAQLSAVALVCAFGLRIYRLNKASGVWNAIIGGSSVLTQNYAALTLMRDGILLSIALFGSHLGSSSQYP